jgi:hypothetical protein
MKFNEWFKKLGKAWCELDPEKAIALFSKDVEYYESVFEKPCENWDKVYELWKVIPENQKDVTFEFKIVAEKDNLAVANWKVNRTFNDKKQKIDGIFIIKLNEEGLCNYFKQWRSTNETN